MIPFEESEMDNTRPVELSVLIPSQRATSLPRSHDLYGVTRSGVQRHEQAISDTLGAGKNSLGGARVNHVVVRLTSMRSYRFRMERSIVELKYGRSGTKKSRGKAVESETASGKWFVAPPCATRSLRQVHGTWIPVKRALSLGALSRGTGFLPSASTRALPILVFLRRSRARLERWPFAAIHLPRKDAPGEEL